MFCFVLIWLALLATNLDFVSAFSAVVATMNNLGPGLGEVAKHYGAVSEPGKLTLCLAMLMGRLEVFTLLVLLTPAFWRHDLMLLTLNYFYISNNLLRVSLRRSVAI